MSNNEKIDEELKKLVIARLGTLNPDSKVLLFGDKPISVRDMLKEVTEGSELGKKIVEVQISYIKMLARGELDV